MIYVPDVFVKMFPLTKWPIQSEGRQAYFFTTAKLLQILGEK